MTTADSHRSATHVGESVAINGCCLTAVQVDGNHWWFEAGPETLSRTNLGQLGIGEAVNLERSLPADARLGGHFVQGHVDCVGHVDSIQREDKWVDIRICVAQEYAAQMVPKGSVAVDGVSLTLIDVERDRFNVALIPHTLQVTTLGSRSTGDPVNIETDILGKYVQRFLQLASDAGQ